MKIVVTGYKGFIGSHLVSELKNEDLVLIEQDDYPLGDRLTGAEAVVHLGAIAGARSDVPPYEYFDYNVKRTVDLLEAASRAKARKFIFISTCTVSHGIKNVYDVTKAQGEQWCGFYRGSIPDIVILRLYNVYGDGDSKSVIAKFLRALSNGTPIIIHGTGNQRRDFIHVQDVVRGIRKALYSEKVKNRAFEVGTGREVSINNLAKMIFRLSGKEVPIKRGPLPYAQLVSAKCPRPLFVEKPMSLEEGLRQLLRS